MTSNNSEISVADLAWILFTAKNLDFTHRIQGGQNHSGQ